MKRFLYYTCVFALLLSLLFTLAACFSDEDGAVYDGQRDSGYCYGEGTITWPDGTVTEGRWENGNRVE